MFIICIMGIWAAMKVLLLFLGCNIRRNVSVLESPKKNGSHYNKQTILKYTNATVFKPGCASFTMKNIN